MWLIILVNKFSETRCHSYATDILRRYEISMGILIRQIILRNVEKGKKFVLSSSLRIPDPSLLGDP